MNKKTKKILIISSIATVSLITLYFGGTAIAARIITDVLFDVRGSTEETVNTDNYFRLVKTRRDFPSLNERKECTFQCSGETLYGYLYEVPTPKGIIITAHGVNTFADSNHALYQDYFVNKGWDVFAIDMMGCGKSTGKGMKTLFHSRYCVREAVKYIQNLDETKDLPICLFGHSWGGYGVLSASNDVVGVKAVVSMSAFNQPAQMMYGFADYYLHGALNFTKPALDLSLRLYYGKEPFFNASTAIKNNPEINYYVIHGKLDDIVPLKTYSVYSKVVDKDFENVQTLLLENVAHTQPWRSQECMDYFEDVSARYNALLKEYHNNIPVEVMDEFVTTFDIEKTSVINTHLFDSIEEFYTTSVN